MKKYKVFFYRGDELTVKTRVAQGYAWVDEKGLHVAGKDESFLVLGSELRWVEMFRLHGLGRVLQVDHSNGRVFISVIRLMIGQFAFINFLKTGALQKQISHLVPKQE
jgi:hypothetical protein